MSTRIPGPVEDATWPERLPGHVVDRSDGVRIHGYDVEHDLARSYSFVEVVMLTLTGELPDRAAARAFELVLIRMAPVSIGEAPAHAAALTRMMGASTSAAIGTGVIALAEDARWIVEAHGRLLAWLRAPSDDFPKEYAAESDAERAAVAALRDQLLEVGCRAKVLDPSLDAKPMAALVGVLFELGFDDVDRLQAALIWSRMPCVAAEGLGYQVGHFREYPMDLPAFRHEGASQ